MRRWQLTAEAGEVACGELICFPLDVSQAEYAALAALLDITEGQRAARFRTAQLTHRFTVAHARLRQVLAQALGTHPQALQFANGPHGKPELVAGAGDSSVQFNLSHSGGWGLVGWAHGRAIGVDIECWRDMNDEAALVRRYFSAAEIAAYEALPGEERREGFFNAWTRKEAYVKALGRGLTLSLASFDVSLGRGADACLMRAATIDGDTRTWSLGAPDMPQASLAVVLRADNLKISSQVETARPIPISG